MPNTSLLIEPLQTAPNVTVQVPGSKSITNRALILAALNVHSHPCVLRNALQCEDTDVMIRGLQQLGFQIDCDWNASQPTIHVSQGSSKNQPSEIEIFAANSGTTIRFLTALVSLRQGRFRLDGVQRMRERPIHDLLGALKQVGVEVISENGDGCPPIVVRSDGWKRGDIIIRGDVSSQYLSAILMSAPSSSVDVTITLDGPLVSEPYIDMTLRMMAQWALVVEKRPGHVYHIPGRQSSKLSNYFIEPDASAASYFFGAAAVTGGTVRVPQLGRDSLQGDVRFVEILKQMGCRVDYDNNGIAVHGEALHGVDVDMNDVSDTVMTLAAVACFADGPTTIRNVGHIRHKETDRLTALAVELRKLGVGVDESDDGLTIHPAPMQGAEIATYDDHRMAMSMALIGLRIPGVVIQNSGCVAKTYPGFFDDFEKLRQTE